ncbi:MAG: hypothetical protein WCV92_03785 [Candidatus Buchananbacteria bacterium]
MVKINFTNKISIIGTLIIFIFIILIGFDVYQKNQQIEGLNNSEILKTSKENIIDYQIIDSNDSQQDNPILTENIVKYRYTSNKEVPIQTYNGLKEDLTKRTANSITFLESVTPISDKLQKEKYVSQFFSGQTWQKSGDKWYRVETATTSKTAFLNQTKLTTLDHVKEFFGRKALADTFYSGAGDGYTNMGGGSWVNAHDSSISGNVYATNTSINLQVGYLCFMESCVYSVARSFLPLDTSAIPSNASIISSTLSIYVTNTFNQDNDGLDYINIVQTNQPDSTTLTTSDHNNCGVTTTPVTGATAIDITGILTSSYATFTLNDTGLGWIKKSGQTSYCGSIVGVTCLGLREGHDMENNKIDAINSVTISTSEETAGADGIDQDPKLIVTYSVVAPTNAIIDGGTIKIDGGTIKID